MEHRPSGERVTVNSFCFRSVEKAKAVAIRRLRSRLYAVRRAVNSHTEVAVYDLPGNMQYPHELATYRADKDANRNHLLHVG